MGTIASREPVGDPRQNPQNKMKWSTITSIHKVAIMTAPGSGYFLPCCSRVLSSGSSVKNHEKYLISHGVILIFSRLTPNRYTSGTDRELEIHRILLL